MLSESETSCQRQKPESARGQACVNSSPLRPCWCQAGHLLSSTSLARALLRSHEWEPSGVGGQGRLPTALGWPRTEHRF